MIIFVIRVHLRAYMIDQILRFLQHIAQESPGLLLFYRIKYRSTTPASKQTGKELAILAGSIIVINKKHSLVEADQVGCHGQVRSTRTFDTLFLEYL